MSGPGTKIRLREIGPHRHRHLVVLLLLVRAGRRLGGAGGPGRRSRRRRVEGRAGSKPVDFTRDIRPILADKCFKCHGPDARQRKGKLRLDNRRDATAPAASGSAAIVPGKLDESELYRRITSDDPDERMPPAKSGKSLSAAEVARLKTWIEEGAEYQGALGVRRRRSGPTLPAVKNAALVPQPDRPLRPRPAREARGSRPSPEADKVDAAPPAQPRPDRPAADDRGGRRLPRRRRAGRLRASWSSGCWTRRTTASAGAGIWLDAARYADSDGYEKDKPRQVWFYRDWVINALNRDLPYDQFIIEQIAGDLLPGRRRRTRSSPPASCATR